jgi:TetR/AcrR family transcriptional repressor of nem operon
MPYTREHKNRSRERILTSALRLFSERGFAQVTIDEVMKHAGLTRGGFYAHFDSKEQLYDEAIRHGIATSTLITIARGPKGRATLQQMVNSYLTRSHAEGKVAPCPLAFFSADVSVREERVRNTYTQAFQSLANAIGAHAGARGLDERSLTMAVLMVCGVAVCTALTDGAMKERLLAGCRRTIMDMVAASDGKAPLPHITRTRKKKPKAA